jgi:hypothetical protein
MNTARELATTQLFDGLAADDLAAFAGIAQEKSFEPEQVVYEAGSAGDSFYVIVDGSFRVRVADEHGEEVDVATLNRAPVSARWRSSVRSTGPPRSCPRGMAAATVSTPWRSTTCSSGTLASRDTSNGRSAWS